MAARMPGLPLPLTQRSIASLFPASVLEVRLPGDSFLKCDPLCLSKQRWRVERQHSRNRITEAKAYGGRAVAGVMEGYVNTKAFRQHGKALAVAKTGRGTREGEPVEKSLGELAGVVSDQIVTGKVVRAALQR